jgi:hypothetical protein
MIKHILDDWPEANRHKKGWWYKMQLFNQEHFNGDLLYLDLDVVIVNKLDWITKLSTNNFWSIRDFRYVQKEHLYQINSSMMWWNVPQFNWVWQKFKNSNIKNEMSMYKGDQDYIDFVIPQTQRQYFPEDRIISWRWQSNDGGMIFPEKTAKRPGAGTVISDNTSVLVFHGQPKPHNLLEDVVIKQHWT